MLKKIIAAILTVGAMWDYENSVKQNGVNLGVNYLDKVDNRACLWSMCYKSMLKYLRIEVK